MRRGGRRETGLVIVVMGGGGGGGGGRGVGAWGRVVNPYAARPWNPRRAFRAGFSACVERERERERESEWEWE